MTVVPFPGHKWHRCPGPPTCDRTQSCAACELAYCVTCCGAESSLPTHCPGRPLTPSQQDDIAAGLVDYRRGEWVHTDARGQQVTAGLHKQETDT